MLFKYNLLVIVSQKWAFAITAGSFVGHKLLQF